MSTLGDIAKAIKAGAELWAKKYDGAREDRLKREKEALEKLDAQWRRRQEGWREKSTSKILGG